MSKEGIVHGIADSEIIDTQREPLRVELVHSPLFALLASYVASTPVDWEQCFAEVRREAERVGRESMYPNLAGTLLELHVRSAVSNFSALTDGAITLVPVVPQQETERFIFHPNPGIPGGVIATTKATGNAHAEYDVLFVIHDGREEIPGVLEIKNTHKPMYGRGFNPVRGSVTNLHMNRVFEPIQEKWGTSRAVYGVAAPIEVFRNNPEKVPFCELGGQLISIPAGYREFIDQANLYNISSS